jgi:hypothetical protein
MEVVKMENRLNEIERTVSKILETNRCAVVYDRLTEFEAEEIAAGNNLRFSRESKCTTFFK